MDTIELLNKAGNRAEALGLATGMDGDAYFESMGLDDDEVVHAFVMTHAKEIVLTSAIMGNRNPAIGELMGTSMLFGLCVGYQMALIREEES